MRNKIFGGIGMVWGGAILLNWLTSDSPAAGSSAYQSGASTAILFALVMFGVGAFYFFKKPL